MPLVEKLKRSIRTRGIGGTLRESVAMAFSYFRNPHVVPHLLVPWEMLRHPRHAVSWMHDRVSTAGPAAQGLPWIAWPCIDFMAAYLRPTHHVFEWGGGGSTLFFLNKGCRVTTVESSDDWVEQLEARVRELGGDARSRWELRHVPVIDNDDPAITDYIDQVKINGPWDLVMVDGWSRFKCLKEGLHHVKQGGVLVLDNANQKQFVTVPEVMRAWERHKFRGLGVARSWVTQTDAYVRRNSEPAPLSAKPATGAVSA
jgi:predicted O-methyltransferase YrrM